MKLSVLLVVLLGFTSANANESSILAREIFAKSINISSNYLSTTDRQYFENEMKQTKFEEIPELMASLNGVVFDQFFQKYYDDGKSPGPTEFNEVITNHPFLRELVKATKLINELFYNDSDRVRKQINEFLK